MKRVIGLILVLMLCAAGFAAAEEQMTADELCDQAVECFHGEQPDYAKGIEYLEQAAEQGHANAQGFLGQCYFQALGVEANIEEGLRLLTLAAEQGDALHQYNLGYAYTMLAQMGYMDFVEAHRWMKLAAEQGHAYAQHNLDAIQ